MEKSEPSHVFGLAGDLALILTFCCVPIGAGHGVGLLGLFLFDGNLGVWNNPFTIGRFGIVLMVIDSLFSKRGFYLFLEMAGLSMIVLTWIIIAFKSGIVAIYFIFSLSFLVVLAVRLYYFHLQLQRL